MSAAIHLAKPEHLPKLLPLVAAFHNEEGLEFDDAHREAALRPLLEGSPLGLVYLIGPPRAPAGYVALTFGWSIEFGGMDGFIDEIYLRPQVRGRGLATDALRKLLATLAETELKALHLEVHHDNQNASKFYGKLGFKRRDGYALMSRQLG